MPATWAEPLPAADIVVCSPNRRGELDALKAEYPDINVSVDNEAAVSGTDMIILAVKPWMLDTVMNSLKMKIDFDSQMLVSIVAGATLDYLAGYAYAGKAAVFQLIPNTAISVHQSMTFMPAAPVPRRLPL